MNNKNQKLDTNNKYKKILKLIAFLVALILIGGIGWFANGLVGNPISKMLATNTAEKYLAEHYGNTDYYIRSVNYSFKDAKYLAHIASPSSVDTYFSFRIDMDGRFMYDNYEDYVTSGFNTANRINMEYRDLVDSVLESPSYPYITDICFGDLRIEDTQEVVPEAAKPYLSHPSDISLKYKDLELDKQYDISKLGAEYGHLVLYICDETVTVEKAAEILLETKRLMDEAGAPFDTVEFELSYPRPEDFDTPRKEGEIRALYFRADDIYEEGMIERMREADENADAYYDAMDKIK